MKSILAGIAIAIGAYINLRFGGIAGAVFFSVGLYLVCNFELKLYTGKVGYTGIVKNLPILLGNLIGSLILLFYPMDNAQTIIQNKLSTPLYISFINAIICGILIYAAVEMFKKGKDYMIAVCVPSFILQIGHFDNPNFSNAFPFILLLYISNVILELKNTLCILHLIFSLSLLANL